MELAVKVFKQAVRDVVPVAHWVGHWKNLGSACFHMLEWDETGEYRECMHEAWNGYRDLVNSGAMGPNWAGSSEEQVRNELQQLTAILSHHPL